MSLSLYHLLLIIGMALVTYLPRALPLMLLSSRSLNPVIERWLRLIPPAVLAALLAPELLLQQGESGASLNIALDNVILIAALPSFLVAWFSKNFFGTVIFGMGTVALCRYIINVL